jgi:hypothetical protein
MDIDMAALRALEREKEIPFEAICEAIETALLSAYHKTGVARPHSRVELDRKTGHVTVWAKERIETPPAPEPAEGEAPAPRPEPAFTPEFDDTPDDFGRFAATIARQLIMQRIRDAEDESKYGEFAGKVGDIVSGVIQQGRNPNDVLLDLGRVEAVLTATERVPEEKYAHGERLKAYVYEVEKGLRGPRVKVSRTHPNLVKLLFALEVPEIADGSVEIFAIAREAGHRPGQHPRRQRQGIVHRSDGPAGAQRHARAARREDRHRRLQRRPGRVHRPRLVAVAGQERHDCGRRDPLGTRRGAGLPALSGDRQGGSERPARSQADRLAHRHPIRHRGPSQPGGLTNEATSAGDG